MLDNYQSQSSTMAQGFMARVYGWMCAGLAFSAAISYYILATPEVFQKLSQNMGALLLLALGGLGIILYMSFRFATMSYGAVVACFIFFTGVQGVLLAPVLARYTGASVVGVFLTASLMFLCMAVYGTVTKADLSSMGNILFMGLIGLILSGLINTFLLHSPMFNTIISAVGVGIFAMFIAYDVQMLRKLSAQAMNHPQEMDKFAVMGALNLYLNMLNLFMYLLQLFGQEKNRD